MRGTMAAICHEQILPYETVQEQLRLHGTVYLLLGNGFSMGCDPVFM